MRTPMTITTAAILAMTPPAALRGAEIDSSAPGGGGDLGAALQGGHGHTVPDLNGSQGPFVGPDYGPAGYRRRWAAFIAGNADPDVGPAGSPGLNGRSDDPGDPPPTSPMSADLDDDGRVDVVDMVRLLLAWGTCPVNTELCRPDLTGDGLVNVEDLVELIRQWG